MISLVKPFIAPPKELMPELEKILYSGFIAEGAAVYEFENVLRKLIGNENTLALSSGTAALHIALELLNVGVADEIISTPLTAEPTNTTIAITGAKVVWADVNPCNGLLCPKSVRSKITNKTKAIMLVNYAGMVCDMDEFSKISKEFNIPIIEDAAHSLGAQYNGKPVGTYSDFTCFSFQAIKHVTTIDGGAICFKNSEMMAKAKKLRWFGLDKGVPRLENDITKAGYKYNMNNVNATIGLVQFRHYKEIIQAHIENGKFYDEALKNVAGVTIVKYAQNTQPSYWLYTMMVERRDEFIKMMESNGITASMLHHRNDTHSVFANSQCELPNMEEFYSKFVHIPCGWWVTSEDRQAIVNAIQKGW